jgi:DNA-binding FadR family transcriptional regulator
MLQGKKFGSAQIAAQIRQDVLGGKLHLHDPLPSERQIAAQFDVSRGTIREALKRLARENLIEIRRGSGAYVIYRENAPADNLFETARPLELMDARFALEPHICRLAVLHGQKRDFEKLDDLLTVMERSEDDHNVFSEADSEFHGLLAAATGNRLLTWMIAQVNLVRARDEWTRMRRLTLDRRIIAEYNVQHRRIVEALRSREAETAAAAMKQHLETARLSLTRSMAT